MQLTIDGETFRVEVEGAEDKPTVMLSPSLGSDLSLFDAQMPALLEHFRVVRYDPRGHGGSTTGGGPYSLARLGRDALGILDALEIETTHFIGLSMGGAVGQWLLVNAPERIDRTVLANTAARIGEPQPWNARIADVLAKGTQAIAGATMDRWFSPAFRQRVPEIVALVEAVFRKTSSDGYAGACAALRDMDLREAILSIERPVLIVTGRDDAVTSEADVAHLTSAIRGARHVELDCRHVSNIEQSSAFDATVVAFLTSPLPARAGRTARTPSSRRAGGRISAARSPLKATVSKEPKPGGAKAVARTRATPAKAATAKNLAAKNLAAKNPAAENPAAKKPARKPTAERSVRKAVAVPATASKAVAKPAAKKAISKKIAAKTVVANKTAGKTTSKEPSARRPATTRRASPQRPARPGGRKR